MSAASASVNKTPKQISTSPKKALESTTEKSLSAVSKITSPIKSNPEVKLPKLQAEQPEDKQSDEEVTTSPIVKASKKRKSHRIIDSDEENVPENVSKEVKTDSNETEQLQNSDDEIQEVAPPEKPGQTEESRKSSEKKANKLSSQPPSKKVKESKTPKSEKKTNSKPTPKSSAPTSEKKTKVASNAKELSSVASMLTPKSDKAKLGEEKSENSAKKEPAPEPKPDPSPVDSSKKANTSTTSATDFAPNTESYRPIEGAFWKEGEQMPYLALAKTFKLIEEEPSRLKITLTLTNLFRSAIRLSPKDVLSCVYLSLNKLGPAYEGQELGIGETLLMKALAQATGRNVDKIKENLHSVGDLGIVAEQSRTSQKMLFVPARLTVKTVFDKLKSISEMSGNSVMSKKIEKIRSLLVACQECEARFILRTLAGKLRIGLAEQTVLTSLGQAFAAMESDKNSDKALNEVSEYKKRSEDIVYLVKSTYCEHPNLENIIKAVLEHGIDDLSEHCKLTPGIPLKPMLAHPAKGVQDILSRLDAKGAFTSEYKYDGERAQIHIFDKQVKIFSRNQEDNSTKYPDVVKIAESIVKESVRSCIIDSEIVAWDAEKKSILPFQVLTTRKRKDVQEENIKVQVCIYAFDMLYLNGESMVPKSLRERRDAMRNSLNEIEGKLAFATCSDTNDTDEIAVFLDESIKGNCEGLMIKTLDSYASYEIARRSHNWLKLKKDYLEGKELRSFLLLLF